MKIRQYSAAGMTAFLILLATSTFATEWALDSKESQLNFISVKKTHIAEVHQFTGLKGDLDDKGNFRFEIDLNSVDTNIAIRDERMREYLFQTKIQSFSQAIVTAKLDDTVIDLIPVGASETLNVEAKLALHGETKLLNMELLVTRLADEKLLVISAKPVLLKVDDFALVAGVEKLKELAKLPSISYAVPVTFELMFTGYNE